MSSDWEPHWEEKQEGKTRFRTFVDAPRIYDSSVFFNPKMVINRDFTLLALEAIFSGSNTILNFFDAFAGTGIRAYRILNELRDVRVGSVILNDINPMAIRIIKENIAQLKNNDVKKVVITKKDANDAMAELKLQRRFVNVIDLDPFGTPIHFIDNAIKLLREKEGYLFLTATDLQVLCGKFPQACLRLYNAIPTRNYLCHEIGIRILIYNLLITAGRIDLAVEPLLSYHHEHFLRIKIRLLRKKQLANEQHKKIGFVDYCTDCSYYQLRKLNELEFNSRCPNCNSKLKVSGPMWLGELYNKEFVREMLNRLEDFDLPMKVKIQNTLHKIYNESDLPPMFYYVPYLKRHFNKYGRVKINALIEKIKDIGFAASRTVFDPNAIKTEVPYNQLCEIVKEL